MVVASGVDFYGNNFGFIPEKVMKKYPNGYGKRKMYMLVKIMDITAITKQKSTLSPWVSREAFIWSFSILLWCREWKNLTCVIIWLIAKACSMSIMVSMNEDIYYWLMTNVNR